MVPAPTGVLWAHLGLPIHGTPSSSTHGWGSPCIPSGPGCVRCHRWVTAGDIGTSGGRVRDTRDRTQHLTCQPVSPARADPSSKCFGGCEKLEEKQKPLPTRVLLLAPVWMLCPGRIRPNPFLIKKYICIPDKQCPMPAGKLPAQLSFFSLLWPHHDANTELSSHSPRHFPSPVLPLPQICCLLSRAFP